MNRLPEFYKGLLLGFLLGTLAVSFVSLLVVVLIMTRSFF